MTRIEPTSAEILALDRAHCWHPFTPLREWENAAFSPAPPVIVSAEGAILRDADGREYLDGNSSIWTNLHGHRHPRIDAAVRAQLGRIAHSSFLGATHPEAALLAAELSALWPPGALPRVFFSDDGSTAIEAALRMARLYHLARGDERRAVAAFDHAYHGDTLGAAALGGISLFHGIVRDGTPPLEVERVAGMEALESLPPEGARRIGAVVIEPLVQGAAGMRLWPAGMLRRLRAWCDLHGALLIADEVLTGFGRTGTMFACEQEEVVPDLLCLAKGLTGGWMPLAATLATAQIYETIAGPPAERRAFYYGHSYTANPLGCAAARANLAVFREERTLELLQPKIARLSALLADEIAPLPAVRETRQCGFIAGIELQPDPTDRPPRARAACLAARAHGLLTRNIAETITLLPPFCVTDAQLAAAVEAIRRGIVATTGDAA